MPELLLQDQADQQNNDDKTNDDETSDPTVHALAMLIQHTPVHSMHKHIRFICWLIEHLILSLQEMLT